MNEGRWSDANDALTKILPYRTKYELRLKLMKIECEILKDGKSSVGTIVDDIQELMKTISGFNCPTMANLMDLIVYYINTERYIRAQTIFLCASKHFTTAFKAGNKSKQLARLLCKVFFMFI